MKVHRGCQLQAPPPPPMAKAMCKTMAFTDRRELAKIKGGLQFFGLCPLRAGHGPQVTDLSWFLQISP